ncbi:MAG: spinster family MFS transporter [Promethearchaeota archaeon]
MKKKNNAEIEVKIPGRRGTQGTINLANVIDNADQQLFSSVFPQVQSSLGIGIVGLGSLTGVRTILQAISTPIWGWWSDRHSRKRVLSIGCFVWAIFTILIAFTFSYIDILIYRALTGIGLAVIVPTAQSLIADYFSPKTRGKAFGWLGLTGVLGAVFGALFATFMVSYDFILGIEAWRFVFIVWGIISIIVGILVLIFLKDPIRGEMEPELKEVITARKAEQYRIQISDFKKIFKTKTFVLIFLQGTAGSIPWSGLTAFMITWFQYIGYPSFFSGIIFVVLGIGAALGNLFGGWIGDKAAKWNLKRGRLIIAQISVLIGIPMTAIIFILVPMSTNSLLMYLVLGGLTGFGISWTAGGCNNPIFSEIFPPEIRSSAYAVDRVFEGSFGALGSIFVSIVAASFGFITPPLGTVVSDLPVDSVLRITNMQALAMGMFLVALIPWIICLILYTLVYFTYPKDYEKMRVFLENRAKKLEE